MLPQDSEILCVSKRNESSDSNRYLYTHDHRSTVHNRQRVEVTLVLWTVSLAPPKCCVLNPLTFCVSVFEDESSKEDD